MSTILDALRKVEREREPSAEATLSGPVISPEVRRRRTFPVAAVVVCALVGFSGGALLSWWTPSEAPVEMAALPAPPPPPDIAVPRPPLRAQPKAPVAAPAEKAAVDVPVAAAPPVPAPPAAAPTVAAPAAAAAPAEPPTRPAEASAPAVIAEKAPAPAPAEASRPIGEPRDAGEKLAALDKQGSALEPSPFGAAREATRDVVSNAPKTAPAVAPPLAVPAPPTAPAGERDELAAIAPAAPEAPALEAEPEPAPEPEAPAETLFDTGRSPPGAPKVALSFLQWSKDPARRFAFISIDGAPSQRVHEGEVAAGLTVAAITPTGVQFKREGTTFVIRPRH